MDCRGFGFLGDAGFDFVGVDAERHEPSASGFGVRRARLLVSSLMIALFQFFLISCLSGGWFEIGGL